MSDTEKPITTEMRLAVADALIAVWEADGTTQDIPRHIEQTNGMKLSYTEVATILGVAWLADRKLKSFVHTNFRRLSDVMWEARSNANQINAARRACGIKAVPGSLGRMKVGTRALDKKFDWSTVK